jgi:hypothetical protein
VTAPSAPQVNSAYLIWEDADHETWWLARSHDEDVNYVVARDSITAHVLVLRQKGINKSYKVIATIPMKAGDSLESAIAEAKRLGIKWIGSPQTSAIKQSVNRWRFVRWGKIAVREVPLAIVSLCVGIVLALIVSAFFIATDMTGWTMVVVGTVFGTFFGWVLKWVADQKLASLTGAIGRFITVTGSATLGAMLTVLLFLILFGA